MALQTQLPPLLGVQKQETADSCRIKADVTGFNASDVTVNVADDTLIVELTSRHRHGQSYYLGECETEHHQRAIPLGFGSDKKNIMTHFNNGKLEILVQKAKQLQSEPTASAA